MQEKAKKKQHKKGKNNKQVKCEKNRGKSKRITKLLAVKGINFEINKGKIMGLLGPNGCGKSTTIGMMLGLIKPTSGSVTINGLDIENNRTNLLEKMNFISPYVELPKKLTIEENLKVYGKMYGGRFCKSRNANWKNY